MHSVGIVNFKGLTATTQLTFDLEYVIRKVEEDQVGLKLNGAHQLLAYADDVDLLGDNTNAIKKTPKF
jgi:hypothetical protein